MKTGLSLGFILALAGNALAETTDCAALARALQSVGGYEMTALPQGMDEGWCVLDGANLRAAAGDAPELSAERLRLRGSLTSEAPASLEIDIAGLRLSPKLGDKALDDRLRSLVRLQTVDFRLTVAEDAEAGVIALRQGEIRLSGGSELRFNAGVRGKGLSLASFLRGKLISLDLEWRNDGKLLRPVMEIAGERLDKTATGAATVDVSRRALRQLVDTLPAASLPDPSRKALEKLIRVLPQGRGVLTLSFTSDKGMGAIDLASVALSDDPLAAAALERLLQGSMIWADWTPGLAP
jgi:hypothetical protein